jgi:hypothetical protein
VAAAANGAADGTDADAELATIGPMGTKANRTAATPPTARERLDVMCLLDLIMSRIPLG